MARKKKSRVPILDLHGCTKDQVFIKIEDFLRKHRHLPKIKIMTGKGSGVIQQTTKKYMELGSYPWEYVQLPNGNKNTGVLLIFLN